MSQRKTLSKPYAYVRNPVWIETAVWLYFFCIYVIQRYIESCKMLCTWKKIDVKKKEGWAIRGTIGSCPQVPVILKSVSDPMLCATSHPSFFLTSIFFHVHNILQLSMYHSQALVSGKFCLPRYYTIYTTRYVTVHL
jgi:hypothetical protein